MKTNEISKTFYSKLKCKFFVLGSPLDGESIMFVLYGDDQIIYSCITDSFVVDKSNIPIAVADQYGIDYITDVFWTHPHDDHSEGLIEIIEKFKPEHVYIPSNLHTLPDVIPKISKSVLDKINEYKSYDRRYKYQPAVVDIGANYNLLNQMLNVAGKKVPFHIYAIAPVIGKARRDVITNMFNSLNDFSIAISVNVGDFSALLTGDLQNQMINYMHDELQEKITTPNLFKIPHHGSTSSLEIVSFFDETYKIDAAITTAKKSSKLPQNDVLNSYGGYCEKIYKIGDDSIKFSVYCAEVDILNATIKVVDNQNYVLHS